MNKCNEYSPRMYTLLTLIIYPLVIVRHCHAKFNPQKKEMEVPPLFYVKKNTSDKVRERNLLLASRIDLQLICYGERGEEGGGVRCWTITITSWKISD